MHAAFGLLCCVVRGVVSRCQMQPRVVSFDMVDLLHVVTAHLASADIPRIMLGQFCCTPLVSMTSVAYNTP